MRSSSFAWSPPAWSSTSRIAWARRGWRRARHSRDEAAEGRSWLLAVENAQDASDEVWSELKALAHAMEASDGFGAVVLVGTTELARRLSTRRLAAIAARVEAHVHLLPLDVDEARELLRGHAELGQAELEILHRDASGNPRRLIQLARRKNTNRALPAAPHQAEDPHPGRLTEPSLTRETSPRSLAAAHDRRAAAPEARARLEVPVAIETAPEIHATPIVDPLVPTRPPLRMEEGLIEVGWGGSLDGEAAEAIPVPAPLLETFSNAISDQADAADDAIDPAASAALDVEELSSEEMIEDHYAALQAWTEWAKNRGRGAEPVAARTGLEGAQETEAGQAERPVAGKVWAESQHDHAPYSQLFTRLRQSR